MAIIYGIIDSERRLLKKLQDQVNTTEKNKDSPLHQGVKGELKVLNKLSELDDNFHIFCGLRIDLGRLVTYNRRQDLRKAQMDFVVVSKRGVVLIEAKNWSDEYLAKHKKYGLIIPQEQVDRAGRVLWIALNSWPCSLKNPSVTRVLLSTHGNMQYDPQFKFVNVKDLNNINYFIKTRTEKFSDEIAQHVIDFLKRYVPNLY